MGLLNLLENNGLSIWLRESPSVLAYPTLIAFHTFGMAFLVGTSTGIALRVLGFAAAIPLAPLRVFYRVMWIGLGFSTVSGLLLLMLDARTFLTMPSFYIKMGAIVVALILLRVIRARVFSDRTGVDTGPVAGTERLMAGIVLFSWAIGIMAGRVTAYAAFVARQTTVAVIIVAAVLLIGGFIGVRIWGPKKSTTPARAA